MTYAAIGAFFRGVHVIPPVVRPGAGWVPGCCWVCAGGAPTSPTPLPPSKTPTAPARGFVLPPCRRAKPCFTDDLDRLTPDQRRRFLQAVTAFVDDRYTGRRPFRAGLRVKGVRSAPGIFELTWDGNGRATWQHGPESAVGAGTDPPGSGGTMPRPRTTLRGGGVSQVTDDATAHVRTHPPWEIT